MIKPIIVAVDDDPQVLAGVERDLRRRYAKEYRVLRADSGRVALEALAEAAKREHPVALLVSDERMPGMSGVEFLEEAAHLAPGAKRVLLTAYADTDAAIRAINRAQVDYYLLKPWDPPEDRLYPVLDDLLGDWRASYRPPFEGVRVVGHRWSAQAHEIKDFLARNHVPYQWHDVEREGDGAVVLERAGAGSAGLPVVLLSDGGSMVQPTLAQLAARVGLQVHAERPFYDLAIVGGGPAGLAAAVYGASEGLRTVIIEREAPGGQAGQSSRIENYLGFPVGLSGADLARRAVAQARKFGTEILTPQVVDSVRVDGPSRTLVLGDGSEISAHALMVSTGVSYRRLEVPGIDRLYGAGVYYGAASTEAMNCRDEAVFVVGGGNSAGQAAMFFARYASRVHILVRGKGLAEFMSQYLIDQIAETANIEVRPLTEVVAVAGETHLEEITLRNTETGAVDTAAAAALFIFIGAEPRTDWLAGVVERDARGFVLTGPDLIRGGARPQGWPLDRDPFLLEASVPGIFAAGDVRATSVKRVASGVGEGSVAISFVHQYLSTL